MVFAVTLFILLNNGKVEYGVRAPLPGISMEQCQQEADRRNSGGLADHIYNKQGQEVKVVYGCMFEPNKA